MPKKKMTNNASTKEKVKEDRHDNDRDGIVMSARVVGGKPRSSSLILLAEEVDLDDDYSTNSRLINEKTEPHGCLRAQDTSKTSTHTMYVDSGCTHHMTGNAQLL